jgi:hypothetical protein
MLAIPAAPVPCQTEKRNIFRPKSFGPSLPLCLETQFEFDLDTYHKAPVDIQIQSKENGELIFAHTVISNKYKSN